MNAQTTSMQAASLFDPDVTPPHPFLLAMEYRALAELGAFVMARPFLPLLPPGDGHAVLIVPGFVQDARAVAPLVHALRRLGYDARAWEQGRNLGFTRKALASLREQAQKLAEGSKGGVSLIGWSLGGIFARELAFGRNPNASNLRWLYDLVTRHQVDEISDEMILRIRKPLPVPSTAIYSRMDGVLAWQTCVEEVLCNTNENIEVLGSHSGLGHNLQALCVIADRLAQPSGSWKPMLAAYAGNWFTRPGVRGMRRDISPA
jgi:hypothetical protein